MILLIAALAGLPLGMAAERWAWTRFAVSLGVVPVVTVPLGLLTLGLAALLLAGKANSPLRLLATALYHVPSPSPGTKWGRPALTDRADDSGRLPS